MVQIEEMSTVEQYEMYSKLPKDEIIAMLIESNRLLNMFTTNKYRCNYFILDDSSTAMLCKNCGMPKSYHKQWNNL